MVLVLLVGLIATVLPGVASAAPPSFVGLTKNTAKMTTSTTVAVPPGVANGDVLMLGVHSTGWLNAPAGWTAVQPAYGSYSSIQTFYRVASNEPADYTFTTGANALTVAIIAAYRDGYPASPVDSTGSGTAGGSTVTVAGVTASSDDDRWLVFCSAERNTAVSIWAGVPAGFDSRGGGATLKSTKSIAFSLGDKALGAAGAQPATTCAGGSSLTEMQSVSIALLPAQPTTPAPENTAQPTLTGTAKVSSQLAVSNGSWSGLPTSYAYQWQSSVDEGASWQDIAGATAATFTVEPGVLARLVRARVTASNVGGAGSAYTEPTGPVAVGPPTGVGQSSSVVDATDEITVALPANAQNGDLLLLTVEAAYSSAPGINAPPGWTLVKTAAGASTRVSTFYKIANSEPVSYTVDIGGSTGGVTGAVISAYRGVDLADPIGESVSLQSGGGQSLPVPGLTPAADDSTWIAVCASEFDSLTSWSVSAPAGFSWHGSAGGSGDPLRSISMTVADKQLPGPASAQSQTTCTLSRSSATEEIAFSIELRPALPLPANLTPPTLPGSAPMEGEAVTATPGTWRWPSTIATVLFQWQRCDVTDPNNPVCVNIADGSGPSYTPIEGDIGYALRVVETASNSTGTAASSSSVSEIVWTDRPILQPGSRVLVRGFTSAGEVLTGFTGDWVNATQIGWKWQECATDGSSCVDHPETGLTLLPGASDVGKRFQFVVTATNGENGPSRVKTYQTAPIVQPLDTLARQFRPLLLFHRGDEATPTQAEPWRPITVSALLAEGTHHLCVDGRAWTNDCDSNPLLDVNYLQTADSSDAWINILGSGREDFFSPSCNGSDGSGNWARDCNGGPQSAIYFRASEDNAGYLFFDYWWLYRYNDTESVPGFTPGTIGNHEGDWEGTVAMVDIDSGTPSLYAVQYATHGEATWVLMVSGFEHFMAVVARGTHATYPTTCSSDCLQPPGSAWDYEAPHDGGIEWDHNDDGSCGVTCVVRFPSDASGWAWQNWQGKWGESSADPGTGLGASPPGPGPQARYQCAKSAFSSGSCTRAYGARPADGVVSPQSTAVDKRPAACEAWIGVVVAAVACDPRVLKQSLSEHRRRPDAFRITGSRDRSADGPRKTVSVPGLVQLQGNPLRAGDWLTVSGKARSTMWLTLVGGDRRGAVRLDVRTTDLLRGKRSQTVRIVTRNGLLVARTTNGRVLPFRAWR